MDYQKKFILEILKANLSLKDRIILFFFKRLYI